MKISKKAKDLYRELCELDNDRSDIEVELDKELGCDWTELSEKDLKKLYD